MSDLYWLTDERMARLARYFPRATASYVLMIDATYLKAHRTASSLRIKEGHVGRLIGRTKGVKPCIPRRKFRAKPVIYDKRRNRIDVMFGRLKD